MNVLFLGCLYSEDKKNEYLKNSRRGYQFAAQNFQESLLDGFFSNDVSTKVLTIPSLSAYPQGCRLMKIKDSDFYFKGQQLGRSFGYLNIPFIKDVNHSKVDSWVEEWYSATQGKKYILVYALLMSQMSIAIRAKKRHPELIISIVIPDIPIYMGCNRFYKIFGLQKKNINWIYSHIQVFDAFVVLTKMMIKNLSIENKPYTVIEGICSNYKKSFGNKVKENNVVLLYTGGLAERYGIKDLVKAFMRIPDKNYRLWLCGTGDAVSYINNCAQIDNRIVYYGLVSHKEIIQLQNRAKILVNPRHSNEEFTKYSFPSKTIEYMASGTPTLMSHLPSIPPEYDKYIYYFEDESIEGMALKMQEIGEIPNDVLEKKGGEAAAFVRNKKNPKEQVKKIIELLDVSEK